MVEWLAQVESKHAPAYVARFTLCVGVLEQTGVVLPVVYPALRAVW